MDLSTWLNLRVNKWIRRALPGTDRTANKSKPVTMELVSDQTGSKGRPQAIPRVVFQTAESGLVHPRHAKAIREFRSINRDLDFILFDASQRDEYMLRRWADHPVHEVYSRAVYGQMKADIFRYCIVFDKGGYYFDFNKGCSVPLTTLHSAEASGIITFESNPELIFPEPSVAEKLANPFNLVAQWAFGMEKGHPFLSALLGRIATIAPFFVDKSFKNPKKALLTLSAPGVFTSVFRNFVSHPTFDSIVQAGIDFHGQGIFRLPGSKLASQSGPYYGKDRDGPVLR